jgi:hypothetical protein
MKSRQKHLKSRKTQVKLTFSSLLLVLSLVGCGYNNTNYIDPRLQHIVDDYLAYKQINTGVGTFNEDIKFIGVVHDSVIERMFNDEYDKKYTIGICYKPEKRLVRYDRMVRDRFIYLRESIYNDPNKKIAYSVVFHELGHCDLDLEHGEGVLMSNEPVLPLEQFKNDPIGEMFYFYRTRAK